MQIIEDRASSIEYRAFPATRLSGMKMKNNKPSNRLRSRLHEIIFEADTPAGKLFDVLLILSIVASVVLVMLDSVSSIRQSYGDLIYLG